jgi:ribonuclease HI
MDRGPNATDSHRPRAPDNVLRQIIDEERRQHGASLYFPLGVRMRYMVRIHFLASNNVAEYEALINGLHIAIELGI